jgi:hypothetical protein
MEEMDASLKQYVIGYIAIVTPIALSILFLRRGSNSPVQLRLKKGDPAPPLAPVQPRQKAARPPAAVPRESARPKEISLNAFFNWNGHSFDAYEALGIPAGSSLESAHSAYLQAISGAAASGDEDSKLFFKAALEAIARPK